MPTALQSISATVRLNPLVQKHSKILTKGVKKKSIFSHYFQYVWIFYFIFCASTKKISRFTWNWIFQTMPLLVFHVNLLFKMFFVDRRRVKERIKKDSNPYLLLLLLQPPQHYEHPKTLANISNCLGRKKPNTYHQHMVKLGKSVWSQSQGKGFLGFEGLTFGQSCCHPHPRHMLLKSPSSTAEKSSLQ